MSVSLIVNEPRNESQRTLYIPIATEKFFNDYWKPNSLQLGLQLVPEFSTGIIVGEAELSDILRELSMLRSWAIGQNEAPESVHLITRLDRLVAELPDLISSGATVYIG